MLPARRPRPRGRRGADGFHARYSARREDLPLPDPATAASPSPFERRYAWHVPRPLDVGAMAAAARLLEGEHDFAAFQAAGQRHEDHGADADASTLHVSRAAPRCSAGRWCRPRRRGPRSSPSRSTGNGFLRHMVRDVVGTPRRDRAAGAARAGLVASVLGAPATGRRRRGSDRGRPSRRLVSSCGVLATRPSRVAPPVGSL